VRQFGSEVGGEVDGHAIAAVKALRLLLATRGLSFTDLGDDLERLATGGLEKDQLKRVFEAGRQQGLAEAERRHAEAQGVFGLRFDGSRNWEAIALYVQREKARVESKHHQFVDDAARKAATSWGLNIKQQGFLLSLFHQVGGRIT
jgi:hypothetical protein